MLRPLIFALACPVALTGCYSGHWDPSEILVTTMPPGASCTLTRHGEKVGEVSPTPGIAMVSRSAEDVAIDCARPGYRNAAAVSHATGSAVDIATLTEGRKGYAYQTPIDITMKPAP
jgi:hypothetical protein